VLGHSQSTGQAARQARNVQHRQFNKKTPEAKKKKAAKSQARLAAKHDAAISVNVKCSMGSVEGSSHMFSGSRSKHHRTQPAIQIPSNHVKSFVLIPYKLCSPSIHAQCNIHVHTSIGQTLEAQHALLIKQGTNALLGHSVII
jgi:hypothetical protein